MYKHLLLPSLSFGHREWAETGEGDTVSKLLSMILIIGIINDHELAEGVESVIIIFI